MKARVWRALGLSSTVLMMCGIVAVSLAGRTSGQSVDPVSPFAKSNLHVWAFEEYDAVQRTPAERARVLRQVGISKAGFVGRHVKRMQEFDAYVEAYRDQQIELVSVWSPINTPTPLEEPHIRMFLDAVDRHRLAVQWWVTLEQFDGTSDGRAVDRAVDILEPLVSAAAARGLRLALYGHGRDAWFTQPENEIAIIERLQARTGTAVGIAYNFHHAHSQMDRFAEIFPAMMPHLIALNLNGMSTTGPQILYIGDGDREAAMIAVVHKAGYRGPVGVIAHQRTRDAAQVLSRNLSGLRQILVSIGDASGASTYE